MVALDGWGRETWGSGAWGEEAPVIVSGVSARFNDLARFSYSLDSQTAGFPVLSNTQSITGTTSAYFGSTNNEIQIPQEQDVIQSALSANNQFTIEFWYYIETATLAPRFVSVQQTSGTSNRQLSIVEYQGQIYVENQQGTRIQAGSVSDQTWTHIAVTADNGTLKLYIDGVLEGTSTGTTFIDAQSEFNIGGTGPWSTSDGRFHLDGYMDLFRVSNNVRYTTNFTPPTSAFTVDDNTTIIFNFDGPNGSQDFELLQLPYSSTDIVGNALVTPNGLQLNIAEFNLTVIGDGSVVTGGEEQTVETLLGTPVITADAPSVTTTGVEAPALVGSVTVTAGAIPLPTGIELPLGLGDVIAESENILPVTGLDLPSTLGAPIVVANAPVSVTGLSMAFADGVATTTASAVVEPNGLEINFSEGTANAPAAVILTGLNATVSLGNMRSTPWANVVPGVSDSWTNVNTNASNTWTEVAA